MFYRKSISLAGGSYNFLLEQFPLFKLPYAMFMRYRIVTLCLVQKLKTVGREGCGFKFSLLIILFMLQQLAYATL